MRKFDENKAIGVEEPNAWENYTISGKWTPVVIESPDIISYKDTVSMIMRLDEMFDPYYPYCGNDEDWRNFCRNYCNVPEEMPSWFRKHHKWGEGIYTEVDNCRRKECDEFNKRWGRFTGLSDGTVFGVSLFASSYIGGPYSFVNFKTGKVGLIHNIGKWPESVGSCKEELEMVTKTWPQYKFFVTFCDDECYGHEQDTTTVCTLMLYNGTITEVMPRKYKDWKYVYKINHLKGSTCAKRHILYNIIYNKTRLWKVTSKFPTFWKIKKCFMENVAKEHFVQMWNNYVIDYNYNIRSMDIEKYFDKKHAMAIMDDWQNILRGEEV